MAITLAKRGVRAVLMVNAGNQCLGSVLGAMLGAKSEVIPLVAALVVGLTHLSLPAVAQNNCRTAYPDGHYFLAIPHLNLNLTYNILQAILKCDFLEENDSYVRILYSQKRLVCTQHHNAFHYQYS